jgi:hypothetical protein
MSKRILVKEAAFIDFLKSFFKAKSDGKETQWIDSVKNKNQKLGQVWQDYDTAIDKQWNTFHKILKSRGIDTKDTEEFMKKYGIKVDPNKSSI